MHVEYITRNHLNEFICRLFTPWRDSITMAASLRKADILFAVSALSDGYFDNDEDRRTYVEVIGDYFAASGDEMEVDTEYEDIDGMCQL